MDEIFNVSCGKLLLTDPCYPKDRNTNLHEINCVVLAKNGEWKFNTRNEKLFLELKDFQKPQEIKTQYFKNLCVDSGLLSAFDYDNYPHTEKFRDNDYYEYCCDVALSNHGASSLTNKYKTEVCGVIVSTTYGDGVYKAKIFYDMSDNLAFKVIMRLS